MDYIVTGSRIAVSELARAIAVELQQLQAQQNAIDAAYAKGFEDARRLERVANS